MNTSNFLDANVWLLALIWDRMNTGEIWNRLALDDRIECLPEPFASGECFSEGVVSVFAGVCGHSGADVHYLGSRTAVSCRACWTERTRRGAVRSEL